jgi:hypothetical protein
MQSTRSKKEVRLMSRLRIRSNNKFGEGRGKAKEHHLSGRRQKKMRGSTPATKKRFFLDHSSDGHDTTRGEKRHFFRRLDRTSILPRSREQKP